MTRAPRERTTAPLALALAATLAAQAWGCYQSVRPHPDADADTDSDSDVDSDSDSDSDVDSDSDSDSDSDADPDDVFDADGDPDEVVDADTLTCVDEVGDDVWPCRQPHCDRPRLRVTALDITAPPALALPVLQSIVSDMLDEFSMIWLLDLDLEDETITTGVGLPEGWPPSSEAEFCNVGWDFAYPQVLREPIRVDRHRVSTTSRLGPLLIPLRDASTGGPLLELPLDGVTMELSLTTDHVLVGWPGGPSGSEYARDWATDGRVTGWIPVTEASGVYIEVLATTLCQLLAGTDCEGDPETWANPPDVMSSGELGWFFAADVGAGAVTIR